MRKSSEKPTFGSARWTILLFTWPYHSWTCPGFLSLLCSFSTGYFLWDWPGKRCRERASAVRVATKQPERYRKAALCLHPHFKIFEIVTCLDLCHREGQKKESRKGGGGRGEGSPSRGRTGRSFTGSCRRQWQRLRWQQRRWEVKKKRVWCQCWELSVELQISAI